MGQPEDFLREFYRSQVVLRERYGIIEDLNRIQDALMEILGIGDLEVPKLITSGLTAEDMAAHLKDYNFKKFEYVVISTKDIDPPVTPDDLPRRLDEKKMSVSGEIWEVHLNDADPFPHPVHGHNYSRMVKVDFRDGKLYKKREEVGSLPKKQLLRLREAFADCGLPPSIYDPPPDAPVG